MPLGQVFEAAKQFAAAAQPKGMPLQLVKVIFSAFSVVIQRHPMIMCMCAATANNKQSVSVCSSDLLATPEARDHAVSLAWLMLNSMDAA